MVRLTGDIAIALLSVSLAAAQEPGVLAIDEGAGRYAFSFRGEADALNMCGTAGCEVVATLSACLRLGYWSPTQGRNVWTWVEAATEGAARQGALDDCSCEIPGFPTPSEPMNLGLRWCGSNVGFQRRVFALQAAGAWCAIAGGTSSSPAQIRARHQEIHAACDRLEATMEGRRIGAAIVARVALLVSRARDVQTKVMTTVFALFAEVERDLISERTREGLAALANATDREAYELFDREFRPMGEWRQGSIYIRHSEQTAPTAARCS